VSRLTREECIERIAARYGYDITYWTKKLAFDANAYDHAGEEPEAKHEIAMCLGHIMSLRTRLASRDEALVEIDKTATEYEAAMQDNGESGDAAITHKIRPALAKLGFDGTVQQEVEEAEKS